MNTPKRQKVIVDVGHFCFQKGYCGIFCVTVEILQRFIVQNYFAIVFIDSLRDDETTLRNLKTICNCDIPFQDKYVEHFVLSAKSLRPTFIGRLEERLTYIFPKICYCNLLLVMCKRKSPTCMYIKFYQLRRRAPYEQPLLNTIKYKPNKK
jgi:hypothetical protein